MKYPGISLVTCSYQQARFLRSTMQSVFDQRYPRLEYIVMDGGSSDGSREIIEGESSRLAHWVSERDCGQTDALAKGFERSTGEIMGWLCSDDLLLPGALMRVAEFFRSNPKVEAVYGDAIWIDEAGRFLRPKKEMAFNRFVFLHDHNYVPQPSMFWRRDLYRRVGGLDRSFDLAMDGDLWERFSRQTRIAHVGEYWAGLRRYAAQKTQSMRGRGRAEEELIRTRSFFGGGRTISHLLRPVARAMRVSARLIEGAYWASVPPDLQQSLRSYEVSLVQER